jgi:pimeloyl-ACP methyl ester carboxylesterase
MTSAPVPERVPSTDGVTVALHDLGGQGPPVLMCHPTGFLGVTWGPLAAQLAGSAHCWALDFRGHGDSTSPASGDFGWRGMGDDVLAVVDALAAAGVDVDGLRAAGHSMGGAALLIAEQRRPGTFGRLWVYEPIVMPPPEGGLGLVRPNPMAEAAARRRPSFPDRETAYANFAGKPPLSALVPEALRAYVDHGMRSMDDGDDGGDGDGSDGPVELKCAPETEAAVFRGSLGHATYERLGEVACPVTVATGGDPIGPVQVAPAIADRLPAGRLERHPDLTHFGPMQDPAGLADPMRAALELA